MGIAYLLFHPNQLRSIIQWKLWHDPVHTRDKKNETPTEASCFRFLNLTSRSFAPVIQELNGELLMPITLFYLVLRALDTIEDDMTIDAKTKEPLLRNFTDYMDQDGWTFNKSGPNEKDRELLVHFDDVIVELKKLKKPYLDVIRDITVKMGNGMADYALSAELAEGVQSIKDYELYCHYVAGLVGEGLTRLFVQSEHARPQLLEREDLTESMGQFLQKVNIIRDIREDHEDGRRFWPKEIWSKYVDNWDDILKPENRTKAMQCQSEMVLNALKHAPECLYYMAGIREQSVFNFVAIPQSMAIATLELCFQNSTMFDRNIKITKGDACKLMTNSTQNLRTLYSVFRDYARRIHKKNDPRDPNYLEISLACGKIEQFVESVFPTQDIKQIHLAQKTKLDEQSMDIGEACVLILVVCVALFGLGGLMIGTAFFLGPRIDGWFAMFNVSGTPDTLAKTTEVLTKTIVHGEL